MGIALCINCSMMYSYCLLKCNNIDNNCNDIQIYVANIVILVLASAYNVLLYLDLLMAHDKFYNS